MNTKFGTPKDLDETLSRIICFRPPASVSLPEYAYLTVKDFISQRTGAALLLAHGNPEVEKAIKSLHESLIERKD